MAGGRGGGGGEGEGRRVLDQNVQMGEWRRVLNTNTVQRKKTLHFYYPV